MEKKRNTTIWLKDSKNKVNTTQIAKPASPVFAVGVIKRTTARSAAALLHYPERSKFSWIAQKKTLLPARQNCPTKARPVRLLIVRTLLHQISFSSKVSRETSDKVSEEIYHRKGGVSYAYRSLYTGTAIIQREQAR